MTEALHKKIRRANALAVFALLASPCAASRLEFLVLSGEKALADAQVCFYPGEQGGLFNQYLQTNVVKCFDARETIDVPAGLWNFYATAQPASVTAWPHQVIAPAVGGKRKYKVDLPVVAAQPVIVSRLRTQLTDDEHFVFWFPGEGERPSFALPLPAGDDRVLLPADHEFITLKIRDGRPVCASGIQSVRALGSAGPAGCDDRSGIELIGTVAMKSATIRGLIEKHISTALVARLANGAEYEPTVKPAPGFVDLFVFKSLPRGFKSLKLLSASEYLELAPREVIEPTTGTSRVVLEEAIDVQGAGVVAAEWNVNAKLLDAPLLRGCDDSPRGLSRGHLTASLLSCDGYHRGMPLAMTKQLACERMAEAAVAIRPRGVTEVVMSRVLPGIFILRLAYPGLPDYLHEVSLKPFERVQVEVAPDYWVVSGRVTMRSAPVAARLEFADATSFSDETGEYRVVTKRRPIDSVEVTPCGEQRTITVYIPRDEQSGDRLDVNVHVTDLVVKVVDEQGHPLPNAQVNVHKAAGTERQFVIATTLANSAGHAHITDVSTDGMLIACAKLAGFESTCSASFNADTSTVALRLKRADLRMGRIVGPGPFVNGRITWVALDGHVGETAQVAADGTFRYRSRHGPEEYVVFMSRSHALYVLSSAIERADGTLEVTIPSAAVMNVTVRIHDFDSFLGLAIGGRVVPDDILARHLALRGGQTFAAVGEMSVIRDVAATAPLTILRISTRDAFGAAEVSDVFLEPAYRGAIERATPQKEGTVDFGRP